MQPGPCREAELGVVLTGRSSDITLTEIVDKLAIAVPRERARELVGTCMQEAGLGCIETSEQLSRLAERMVARGGFAKVVGMGLRISANAGGARAV
jgi:hypothetical protein